LLALLELGVAIVLGFLVSQDDLHYLVPWVIGFGAFVFVAIIAVVVAINVIDPSKLQLGQMTGREFIDYQRVTRGDSLGGEYIEAPPAERGAIAADAKVLPPAAPDEAEDGSEASQSEES
jgi:hypothetical protein